MHTATAMAASRERVVTRRPLDFVALTKPRVQCMVLVTTSIGFYLASWDGVQWLALLHTLIGVAMSAGGTLALNQYLERDLDARMLRTRLRPLPDGRLQPTDALLFGVAITSAGLLYLTFLVNPLSGLVTAISVTSYLFVYTPLKPKTPLCITIGAIPGALPPVTGWVAASGSIEAGAWVLFAILFLWQIPHSLAIAILYREDYARADIKLLPVIDPDGGSTGRQIVVHCLALLAVALLPTTIQLAGNLYFFLGLALGLGFLLCGILVATSPSAGSAKRLLWASLIYLPALLVLMAIDKVQFQ